jgi:hypothetical protein
MFEEMSATIRRRAKGVARRAIRDQLLRSIRLDRGIASVRNSVRGGAKSEDRDLDFHFGVHSMLPEVGMRYKLRSGSAMGLTIGAAGEVDFRFRVDRAGRADFSAGFDGEDTFHVGANIGF